MEQENINDQNENLNNEEATENFTQKEQNVKTDEVQMSRDDRWFYKTRSVVYYILGVIEILLAFRLVFRSLGANVNNPLVASLYSITRTFIAPFSGIFNVISPGGTMRYVIEPDVIIAMIVYAIIAYGLIKLIRVAALNGNY